MAYRGTPNTRGISPSPVERAVEARVKEHGTQGMKWGVKSGSKEPVHDKIHERLTAQGFKLKNSGSTPSGKGASSEYEHPNGNKARVQKSSTETKVLGWDKNGSRIDHGGANTHGLDKQTGSSEHARRG